ncbi:segregation/condensation protein A [Streptomyces sp. NBC_00555]|uniref:segregation and condensation protein A n=1 Tax=Streptomyces sp. NBC_00555 TaxID=2903662 RepID=UPI0022595B59|nr:segregation/condensation protein A [Streptomyces sp. NBC_00555]MCX5014730.1 segregation/condensation protein A [Streptomyces sp. NBC_00555]
MPFPAEPGRPTRRILGRGPGAPGDGPGGPESPAAPPVRSEGGAEPREPRGPADGPLEGRDGPPAPDEAGDAPTPKPSAGPAGLHGEADTARGGSAGGAPTVPQAAGAAPAPPEVRTGAGGGKPGPAAGEDPAEAPHGAGPAGGDGRFTLRLANFEGPFDLLLQLISRHKLDVTEVALSKVTDEFMAHIRAMGPDWDLDQTTEFLVVAATLLDLKAARLLPAAEVEDEADLALLEARDLLFARLLQYRAYKRIAAIFEERAEAEGRRYPRTVGLEPHHADLLPEVVITIGPEGFARLAVKAMQPRAKPQVYVDHIHAPLVSVREQAGLVVRMLKARGEATFQELTEDAGDTLTVVARFLALLELYREKAVVLDQEEALKTLTVRWSGGDGDGMPTVTDEFDQIVEVKE